LAELDKIASPGDLDKFSDYQPLADTMTQIRREYLGSVFWLPRVREIAVFADLHARMADNVLQIDGIAIKRSVRQSDWVSCIRVEKRHQKYRSEQSQRSWTADASSQAAGKPSRNPNAFMNNLNGDALNAFRVASAMSAFWRKPDQSPRSPQQYGGK